MATEVCIDRDDQTTINKLALSAPNVTDGQGRFTLGQIDAVVEDLANSIVADAESNPLAIAVNRYGDTLYQASNYLNGLLRQKIGSTKDYPDLAARWEKGPVSNLEMADFLGKYNQTPQAFMDDPNPFKLARNLDSYYKKDFSSSILGGFCDKFDSIFSSIDAFFDLIGVVEGLIGEALELVGKIQRGYDGIKDLTVQEVIKQLIKEVKKKIGDVIDAVFKEVTDIIDNFDPSKITEGAETFIDKSVVKGIMTAREQMCAFFTEENKKGIKDKVLGLIDYAISLFESPGIEEIQFLIARICSLAANVEALIRDINKPLDDYTRRYTTIVNRLKNISNVNTSTAVRAGAIRFSPTSRQEVINRLEGRWTTPGGNEITNTGNPVSGIKPITAAEYKSLPRCGNVFSGADATFGVEGAWTDPKEGDGIYGYTRVDLDVKVYLKRVYDQIGSKFIITDGWISKGYNKKLEKSEENSHLSGLVIDIKKDMPDPAKFIEEAFKAGFKYVKEYDNFIHLDIRAII